MIEIKNLCKTFELASGEDLAALKNISLRIEDGDVFGIIGLSGAGKSTLVRCINYLEKPTSGEIWFDGVELGALNKKMLRQCRHSMSMIFQGFNLLSQRTALQNVCYPLEITGVPRKNALKKARELLKLVGLEDREGYYPAQLSGGQKQRVAIARALSTDPHVILCDEATSALDPNTTNSILELLSRINKTMGVTVIVITHEMRVIEKICNKVAVIDRGEVVEEGLVKEIFLAPKSSIARELILPHSEGTVTFEGAQTVRIVFDGKSAFEPIISNLTLECGTAVNIIGANTKNIDGKAIGQMLIQLPADKMASQRVLHYLQGHQLTFEEVSDHE